MTALVWGLIGLTVAIAVVDWLAVFTENVALEYFAKPATMLPLIAAATILTPTVPAMQRWFVLALVLSLAGDVFLMLPDEKWFLGGLGSFLLGHVAYIIGFVQAPMSVPGLIVGVVVTFTALLVIGPTLIKGANDSDPRMGVAVLAYMSVISVMVTCAIGATAWLGVVGALLFYLSDFVIGWSRFVADVPHSRIVIISTYHMAQVLLVLSLASPH